MNNNSTILGTPGKGMCYHSKRLMIDAFLKCGGDVTIIDAESEYSQLMRDTKKQTNGGEKNG